MINNYSNQYRY